MIETFTFSSCAPYPITCECWVDQVEKGAPMEVTLQTIIQNHQEFRHPVSWALHIQEIDPDLQDHNTWAQIEVKCQEAYIHCR